MSLRFRDASAADLPRLAAIDPGGFGEEALRQELANAWSRVEVAVADGDEVVGFTVVWTIAGELQLLDIAVDRSRRRAGIGRALLSRVLERARAARAIVTLEVRASNTAARALYTDLGFGERGLRRGYYQATGEDAVLMTWGDAP